MCHNLRWPSNNDLQWILEGARIDKNRSYAQSKAIKKTLESFSLDCRRGEDEGLGRIDEIYDVNLN